MVEHLALSCIGTTGKTKNIFLQAIRDREALKITHPVPNVNQSQEKKTKTLLVQPKITAKFENIGIDNGKKQRCNRAFTRFFTCCGIPFKIVSDPFFIDFINCLCPSYQLPNRITFANSWINQELAHVISATLDSIKNSNNITLGKF